jgi:hypothetical protein
MARLPIPGSDDGTWGDILNTYLSVEHNANGTQKPLPQSTIIDLEDDLASVQTDLAAKYTLPGSGIPKDDLSAAVQASLDNADAGDAVTSVDGQTGDVDLSGTYAEYLAASEGADISAALTAQLAARPVVALPPGRSVFLENVVIPHDTTLVVEGVILTHASGAGEEPLVRTKVVQTTCTATAASQDVVVVDASYARKGAIAAIEAGVRNPNVVGALAGSIDASQTTLILADASLFPASGKLFVEDEIIAWTSKSVNTLNNLTRGALGTVAATHADTTAVNYAGRMYAEIIAVNGSTLTLDEAVPHAMTGAAITLGTHGARVLGGRWKGRRATAGNTKAVLLDGSSGCEVELEEVDECGLTSVFLRRGARGNNVHSFAIRDTGKPAVPSGAAVFLFNGCRANHIHRLAISGDCNVGIYSDTRTSTPDEWDSPSYGNEIDHNVVDLRGSTNPSTGITGAGNIHDNIHDNLIIGANDGIAVQNDSQGVVPYTARNNVVHHNIIVEPLGDGIVFNGATDNTAGDNLVINPGGSVVIDTGLRNIKWNNHNPAVTSGQHRFESLARFVAGWSSDVSVQLADGSLSSPAIRFSAEGNTGFTRSGAGDMRAVVLGNTILRHLATGLQLTSGLKIFSGVNGQSINWCQGSPEGAVTATVGSIALQGDGLPGQTMWRKETGSGNTGWVPAGRHPVVATASLPAAAAAQDGRVLIEDAGAGDRNLVVYAGGQRFRIDGGATF